MGLFIATAFNLLQYSTHINRGKLNKLWSLFCSGSVLRRNPVNVCRLEALCLKTHQSRIAVYDELMSSWNTNLPLTSKKYIGRVPFCVCLIYKGGQSENKFRNRKAANLRISLIFYRFADLPQVWRLEDLRFCGPIIL
jgi:hypothetical protein